MLLYLVRHAQSEGNAKIPGAGKDAVLTDLGHRQAAAAGAALAALRQPVDHVVASPYVRTLQTAEAIRRATGAPASIVPLLHEHHVEPLASAEDWPFLSRAGLEERFPQFRLPPDFAFGPRWHDLPETEAGVLRRAHQVLRTLWQEFGAQGGSQRGAGTQGGAAGRDVRLVVVSHGSPTGKLLMAAVGLHEPQRAAFRVDNASISIVEYFPDWCVVVTANRTEHLAHLGVDPSTQDPGYPPPLPRP